MRLYSNLQHQLAPVYPNDTCISQILHKKMILKINNYAITENMKSETLKKLLMPKSIIV